MIFIFLMSVLIYDKFAHLGSLKGIDVYSMSLHQLNEKLLPLVPPLPFGPEINKNYDQKVFGRFPIYLWISGYSCDELQITFKYKYDRKKADDWDHQVQMVCHPSPYSLSDVHHYLPQEFQSELHEYLIN